MIGNVHERSAWDTQEHKKMYERPLLRDCTSVEICIVNLGALIGQVVLDNLIGQEHARGSIGMPRMKKRCK